MRSLCEREIACTYALLPSIGYLMQRVRVSVCLCGFPLQCDIVLMGCSAVLSNGQVVVCRGGSLVALVARSENVPVLIAAQTYKFVDNVDATSVSQLWPINTGDLHRASSTTSQQQKANPAEMLEAVADDLVSAIITELRVLPPSSAPAVLKAKQLVDT